MSARGDILNNLQLALKDIKKSKGYGCNVGAVIRRAVSSDDQDHSKCPAIAIIDSGIETPAGRVGIYERSKMTIILDCLVRHSSDYPDPADLSTQFNDFLADVRKCIHLTNLGANMLYCRPAELRVLTGQKEIEFNQDLEILHYYDSGRVVEAAAIDVVYGDNEIIEDIRVALYAQMASLRAAMAAGNVAPLPAAVYNSHDQIKMALPAISVGIPSYSMNGNEAGRKAASSSAITEHYDVSAEIRIHTDYQGGYRDEVKLSRLMNSVTNWLETHRRLALDEFCNVELSTVDLNKDFEESYTIGGSLEVKITIAKLHTQA